MRAGGAQVGEVWEVGSGALLAFQQVRRRALVAFDQFSRRRDLVEAQAGSPNLIPAVLLGAREKHTPWAEPLVGLLCSPPHHVLQFLAPLLTSSRL